MASRALISVCCVFVCCLPVDAAPGCRVHFVSSSDKNGTTRHRIAEAEWAADTAMDTPGLSAVLQHSHPLHKRLRLSPTKHWRIESKSNCTHAIAEVLCAEASAAFSSFLTPSCGLGRGRRWYAGETGRRSHRRSHVYCTRSHPSLRYLPDLHKTTARRCSRCFLMTPAHLCVRECWQGHHGGSSCRSALQGFGSIVVKNGYSS